ncbi:hypothetical protein Ahos_1824 [Acidianus hospitalis W1]|uniref:Uncharacterized protein n=1 Tax=Acidianus hospitalis (strain W1) TaxID=933801 RepID=F4B779_ACIHW|nr:hypothetical protein Ahos_1824 [Acidianus hospitalis W1]
MTECRDLAINHRWVMGLQRHGAHISAPTHIGVRDHYLSTKIRYKQTKKISINMKKDSPLLQTACVF